MMTSLIFVVLLALLCHISALTIAPIISDNMVLVRAPRSANIWGSAAPHSSVKAVINSDVAYTVANSSGLWIIQLPPQPTQFNATLTISGDGASIVLRNVAFGETFLCGGQSNMEYVLVAADNGPADVKDSINYPGIRLYAVAHAWSPNATLNITVSEYSVGGWQQAAPQFVSGGDYFSAVCYYFGLELYRTFNGSVPVGLIASSWGGTDIEVWSSPAGISKCGQVPPPRSTPPTRFNSPKQSWPGCVLPYPCQPSSLYNGMISPFTNMRLSGVNWYQGESNALTGNFSGYACRLPAFISDWRTAFNDSQLPFNLVILAPYIDTAAPGLWPPLRAIQILATRIPGVTAANAIDLGNRYAPSTIHPTHKQPVGQRLALNTLQHTFNRSNIVALGPTVFSVGMSFRPNISLIYSVDTALAHNQKLHFAGTSNCTTCCTSNGGGAFSIFTSRNRTIILNETSTIVNGYLSVPIPPSLLTTNETINEYRYNYEDYPQCALYNSANLPALPLKCAVVSGWNCDVFVTDYVETERIGEEQLISKTTAVLSTNSAEQSHHTTHMFR